MRFVIRTLCFQAMLVVIVFSEEQEFDYSIITETEMDSYWFENFHFCGIHLRDSKEEICRTYYYGRLSPFNMRNYEPFQNMSGRGRQDINKECCLTTCNRWMVKDHCNPFPFKYSPTKDSVATIKRLQALRSEMDNYWTVEVQLCDGSVGDIVFQICKMLYGGRLSPLHIPDYTPSNRHVLSKRNSMPSRNHTRSTNRRAKSHVDDCCETPCTRWTLKDLCPWSLKDHMSGPPPLRPYTRSTTPSPTDPPITEMPTTVQVPSTTTITVNPEDVKKEKTSKISCNRPIMFCPLCPMLCRMME